MRLDRPATFLWRVATRVAAADREAAEAALEDGCIAVSSFEVAGTDFWRVEGFTAAEPDRTAFDKRLARALGHLPEPPTLRFDLVPPRDWLAENMRAFPPLRLGRYFIHGSGLDEKPPAGITTIELDAGAAFGSGEHASTAGCLLALGDLARRRRFHRPLDVGCGSGILSIAIAKTWRVAVVATDIDPIASAVAAANATRNGVGRLIHAHAAPGYRAIARHGPFDLIVANILARPLRQMAGDLSDNLRPSNGAAGVAVLSGLLAADGNRVMSAHTARGFRLRRRVVIDGWLTLVIER